MEGFFLTDSRPSGALISQLPLFGVSCDKHAAREVRKMRVQLVDLRTREHLHRVILAPAA